LAENSYDYVGTVSSHCWPWTGCAEADGLQ
jgi:hypothetical protein